MATAASHLSEKQTGQTEGGISNWNRASPTGDKNSVRGRHGPSEPMVFDEKDRAISVNERQSPVFRGSVSQTDAAAEPVILRDQIQGFCRSARDSFIDACEASGLENSELNFMACCAVIERLWAFAKYRDVPFRDLLGILTAALKGRELSDFDSTQKDVLRSAFSLLPIWFLEYEAVEDMIGKFADHDIDITGPISQKPPKRFRIIVEEDE